MEQTFPDLVYGMYKKRLAEIHDLSTQVVQKPHKTQPKLLDDIAHETHNLVGICHYFKDPELGSVAKSVSELILSDKNSLLTHPHQLMPTLHNLLEKISESSYFEFKK